MPLLCTLTKKRCLGVFLYNIFLVFFRAGIHLSSLFNKKARKWVQGRKNIFENLRKTIADSSKIIWVHCASLGEFEQGRPIVENLKTLYPNHKLLLTFFSPSGYEIQKKYKSADWIFYLPVDGPRNAKLFLQLVNPVLVIFVKYEFWYYYLKKVKERNIPLLLVSASFRKEMPFFKWYGSLQREMLSFFEHIFVQNRDSKKLIDGLGLAGSCSVTGDTRFDRVLEIAQLDGIVPFIKEFSANCKLIVAGSTWPEDENALKNILPLLEHYAAKLVLAPHEIGEKHIREIEKKFPGAIRYSRINELTAVEKSKVLIIDNIGMLSKLYRYAHITYVGGGLSLTGLHNVLEAAVYYKVVLFGHYFQKYPEATGLVQSGGGIPFYDLKKDGAMLCALINVLMENEPDYKSRCNAAGEFVKSGAGATRKIINYIQEKRLLTT